MKKIHMIAALLAMLMPTMLFATGNSHSTHYGKMTVTASGSGTVYLSDKSSGATSGDTSYTWNCNKSSSADSATRYCYAKPNTGYKFKGWSGYATSTDNPYKLTLTATATSSSSPTAANMTATFELLPPVTVTFAVPNNGSYTVNGETVSAQLVKENQAAPYSATLVATPAANFRFGGWYVLENGAKTFFSTDASTTKQFEEDVTVGAEFIPDGYAVYAAVAGKGYETLAEALSEALSGEAITAFSNVTIDENSVVPAGTTLTLSSGVTLTVNGTLAVAGTIAGAGTISGSGKLYKISYLINQGDVITIKTADGNECGAMTCACQDSKMPRYCKTTVTQNSPSVNGTVSCTTSWGVLLNGTSAYAISKQSPKAVKVSLDTTKDSNGKQSVVNKITAITADTDTVNENANYVLFADMSMSGPLDSSKLRSTATVDCAGKKLSAGTNSHSSFGISVLNGSFSASASQWQNAHAAFFNVSSVSLSKVKGTSSTYYFYDCGTKASPCSISIAYYSSTRTSDYKTAYFYSGYYSYSFKTADDSGKCNVYGGSYTSDPSTYIPTAYDGILQAQYDGSKYYVVKDYTPPAYVCAVGGVDYESLADAVTAAGNGALITLSAAIELDATLTIPSGKNITISLEKHTIQGGKIVNNGTLVVTDSITGNGTTVNDVSGGIIKCDIENNGTLDIIFGSYTGAIVNKAGTLTTHNGLFSGTLTKTGGTVNLKGGHFTADISSFVTAAGYDVITYGGKNSVCELPDGTLYDTTVSSAAGYGATPFSNSDFTLFKKWVSGSASRTDYSATEWARVAEIMCFYQVFNSKGLDPTLVFDRLVTAGSVNLYAKSGQTSVPVDLKFNVSAGTPYRALSEYLIWNGYYPKTYKAIFVDNISSVGVAVTDKSGSNKGTLCKAMVEIWSDDRASDYSSTGRKITNTVYAVGQKLFTIDAGSNKAMIRPASGAATFYATLDAAMSAAADGGTVMLANDCDTAFPLSKAGTYTFDTMGFAHSDAVSIGEGLFVKSSDAIDSSAKVLVPDAVATTYVVAQKVASVGEQFYDNLTEAVGAANGVVVTLLAATDETVTLGQGQSLKLAVASGVSYDAASKIVVDSSLTGYGIKATAADGYTLYELVLHPVSSGDADYESVADAISDASGDTVEITVPADFSEEVSLDAGKTLSVTVENGGSANVSVTPAQGSFIETQTSGTTTTYVSKQITVEMTEPSSVAAVEMEKIENGSTNAVSDASLVSAAIAALKGNVDVPRTDNTDKLDVVEVITVTPTKIVQEVVGAAAAIIRAATFDVVPTFKAGQSLGEGQKLKFRLPIDAAATQLAAVIYHNGAQFGIYPVQTENDQKFVEVESDTFSPYGYELLDGETANPIAAIGTTGYATLGDALTAAVNGDTIYVFAGTFDIGSDTITVNKQVTITGAGKDTTTLNFTANGKAAISIQASNVTIENMTINQADSSAYNTYHIGIDAAGSDACYSNVTISNLKLGGGKYSMIVYGESFTIDGCDFASQGSSQILVDAIKGNSRITNNTFTGGKYNILQRNSHSPTTVTSSGKLTISDNTSQNGNLLYILESAGSIDTTQKMELEITGNEVANYSNKAIAFTPTDELGKYCSAVTITDNAFHTTAVNRPVIQRDDSNTTTLAIDASANYWGDSAPDFDNPIQDGGSKYLIMPHTDSNNIVVDSYGTTYTPNSGSPGATVNDLLYKVTFVNDDGTAVLYETNLASGNTPVYGGTVPTKAATAQNTFTWNGWTYGGNTYGTADALASVVDAAQTYTATYSSVVNDYTVTVTIPANSTITVKRDGVAMSPDAGTDNEFTVPYGTELTVEYAASGAYIAGGTQSQVVTADSTKTVAAPNDYTVAPAVAQIGSTYYPTLAAAIAAANATAGSDTVTIMILQASVTTGDSTITHNVFIDTELAGGATINFNGSSFTARGGAAVTFADDVAALGNVVLAVDGGSPAVSDAKLVLSNNVQALYMMPNVSGGEICIEPSARVSVNSDYPIYFATGKVAVNGNLASGEGLTASAAEVAGEQQLVGGYMFLYFGRNVVELNNTYVTSLYVDPYVDYWTSAYGSSVAFNLSNSTLYLSNYLGENAGKGFNMGGLGTLTMAGSRLIANGTVAINSGDVVNMDYVSSITAKAWTNNGEVNIDATGIDQHFKVIDYTGTGTMTLADYGTINVTDGEVYVDDNDLWVKKPDVAQVVRDGTVIGMYEALADAVSAAQEGDTVQLLKDIEEFTGTQQIDKSITLDGNGHKIVAAPVATHRDIVNAWAGSKNMFKIMTGALTLKNITLDGGATHPYTFLLSADNSSASITTENVRLLNGGELCGDALGVLVAQGAGYGAAIHLNHDASITVKDGFYACTGGETDGVFPFTGILVDDDGGNVKFELEEDSNANPTVGIGNDLLLVGMPRAIDHDDAQAILDYMKVPSRFIPYTLTLGDGVSTDLNFAHAFTGASPLGWNEIIDYGKEIMAVADSMGYQGLDTNATPVEVGLLTDTVLPELFTFADTNFTVNGNGNALSGEIKYTNDAGSIKNIVLGTEEAPLVLDMTEVTDPIVLGSAVGATNVIVKLTEEQATAGTPIFMWSTDEGDVAPSHESVAIKVADNTSTDSLVWDEELGMAYIGPCEARLTGPTHEKPFYTSLARAIEEAADTGDTVTLMMDIENFTGRLDIYKSITLDGARHTITAKPATEYRNMFEAWGGSKNMFKLWTGNITFKNITLDGHETHAYTFLISADNPSVTLTTENVRLINGGELSLDQYGNGPTAGSGYGAAIHLNDEAKLIVKDGFYAFTGGRTAGVFPFTGILVDEGGADVQFDLTDDSDANPTVAIGDDLLLVGTLGAIDLDIAQDWLDYMKVPKRFIPYTLTLDDGSAYAFTGASPRAWNDIIDYGKEIMDVATANGFEGLDKVSTPVEVGLLTDTELPATFTFADTNFTVNGNGNALSGEIKFTDNAGTIENIVFGTEEKPLVVDMTEVTGMPVALGGGVAVTNLVVKLTETQAEAGAPVFTWDTEDAEAVPVHEQVVIKVDEHADDSQLIWDDEMGLAYIGPCEARLSGPTHEMPIYTSLATAIANSLAGDRITMLTNIVDAGEIALKSGGIFDGYGHTLSGDSTITLHPTGGTVKDVNFSNIKKTGSGSIESVITAIPVADAVFTITGNTFSTPGAKSQIVIEAASATDFTATISGNAFDTGTKTDRAFAVVNAADADKLTLDGNYIADGLFYGASADGANVSEKAYPQLATADAAEATVTLPTFIIKKNATDGKPMISGYATLADAVVGAAANDTILLTADATLDAAVTSAKTLTIDGQGKTLTLSDAWSLKGTATTQNAATTYGAFTLQNIDLVCGAGDYTAARLAKVTIGSGVAIDATAATGFKLTAESVANGTTLAVDPAKVALGQQLLGNVADLADVTVTGLDATTYLVIDGGYLTVTQYAAVDGVGTYYKTLAEAAAAADAAVAGGGADLAITLVDTGLTEAPANWVIVGTSMVRAVAKIGGTYYATLAEAVASAVDGDTVELLRDAEVSATIEKGNAISFTIDGAGHSVKPADGFSGTSAFMLGNAGSGASAGWEYTITNVTFSGFATSDGVLRCEGGATVTVADCTFVGNSATGGSHSIISPNYAKVTVDGCVFTNNVSACAIIDIGNMMGDEGTATGEATVIKNSLFTGNSSAVAEIFIGIGQGKTTVDSNTFRGNTDGIAVVYASNSADITGNLFDRNAITGTGANMVTVLAGPYGYDGEREVNIMDNAFVGNTKANGSTADVYLEDMSAAYGTETAFDISGNYWSDGGAPVAGVDYIAQRDVVVDTYATAYTPSAEGCGVGVTESEAALAQILRNDTVVGYYWLLQEAASAAQDGDTIELLRGTSGETVTVAKSVTITGASDGSGKPAFALTNTTITVNGATVELAVTNLAFAGSSYINANNGKALTVDHVTATVDPTKISGRSAFIVVGTGESQTGLDLTVTNSEIVNLCGTDGFGAAIFGWAFINSATICDNVLGSDDHRFKFIAIKLMNAVDGAVYAIERNTIYGTNADYVFLAIDLYQNNSRANSYTALSKNNVLDVTKTSGNEVYAFDIERNGSSSATIIVLDSGSTLNGQPVAFGDFVNEIPAAQFVGYYGAGVVYDESGKMTAGTFSRAFTEEELSASVASSLVSVSNLNGTYRLGTAVAKIGNEYFGSLADAYDASVSDDTIELLADDRSLSDGSELTISHSITITGAVDENGVPLYTIYGKSSYGTYNDIFISNQSAGINVTIKNVKLSGFGDQASSSTTDVPAIIWVSARTHADTHVVVSNVEMSAFNYSAVKVCNGTVDVMDSVIDCAKTTTEVITKGIEIGAVSGIVVAPVVNIVRTEIRNASSSRDDYDTSAVEIWQNSTVLVKDSVITNNAYGVYVAGSSFSGATAGESVSVTLEGNTIEASEKVFGITSDGDNLVPTVLTVTSGSHVGAFDISDAMKDKGTIAISGGTYSQPVPESFCAAGYVPAVYDETTGLYTVKPGYYVAQVTFTDGAAVVTNKFETDESTTVAQALLNATAEADALYEAGTNSVITIISIPEGTQPPAGWTFVTAGTTTTLERAVAQNITISGETVTVNKQYATIQAAIDDAAAGDTIEVIRNVTLPGGALAIQKSIALTGAVDNEGKPVRTITGVEDMTSADYADIYVGDDGAAVAVTISNLKLTGFGSEAAGATDYQSSVVTFDAYKAGSVLTVTNVEFSAYNQYAVATLGDGTLAVQGCTIDGTATGRLTGGVYAENGAATVSGGTIENVDVGIDAVDAAVAVSGATVTANADGTAVSATSGAAVTVDGGDYAGALDVDGYSTLTVESGHFDRYVDEGYCADGKIALPIANPPAGKEGWYEVVPGSFVAALIHDDNGTVTTTPFASLEAAYAAAASGDTIEMLADYRLSEAITFTKSVTITGAVDEDGKPKYTVYGKPDKVLLNSRPYLFVNSSSPIDLTFQNLNFSEFGNEAGASAGYGFIYVSKNSNADTHLLISNVTMTAFNCDAITAIRGDIEVVDSVIDGAGAPGDLSYGIRVGNSDIALNPTLHVVRTVIRNIANDSTWSGQAIVVGASASVTVSDSIITNVANGVTAIGNNDDATAAAATVTLENTVIEATGWSFDIGQSGFDGQPVTPTLITVTSGTYTGKFTIASQVSEKATIAISGGEFDRLVPEAFCADGYIPDRLVVETIDGVDYYTVKTGAYVARNTETEKGYETLEEALAEIDAAEGVTLLANVTLADDVALSITGAIDLMLDGNTLTAVGHTIAIPAGLEVIVDEQVTGLFVAPVNYVIGETADAGSYVYTPVKVVAKINDTPYTNFVDAVTAYEAGHDDGDVITVVDYDSTTMVAPDDWKFVTDTSVDPAVTTLERMDFVARIESTGATYTSLAKAIAAATTAGDTVTLLADVNVPDQINMAVPLTVDFNGKTVTSAADNRVFKIATTVGAYAFRNGTVNTTNPCYGLFRVDNASTVTVEGITSTNDRSLGCNFRVAGAAQVLVTNCTITATNAGGVYAEGGSTVNVYDSTIAETGTATDCNASAFAVGEGATITVHSGTYSGEYGGFVCSSGGTIEILDGSVTGRRYAFESDARAGGNEDNSIADSIIRVSGGTIDGELHEEIQIYNSATLTYANKMLISGGTFTNYSATGPTYANAGYEISGGWFDAQVAAAHCATGFEPTGALSHDPAYTVQFAADLVYPIEGTGGIAIPLAWATNNTSVVAEGAFVTAADVPALVTALSENGANGMPLWQSYVLGLNPSDANANLRLEAEPVDGDATKVFVTGIVDMSKFANISNVTVTFRLASRNADGTWSDIVAGSASPTFEVSLDAVAGKVLAVFADIVTE